MADQDDNPSSVNRADGTAPSEKINLESVIDPSEITALDVKERVWRFLQPRRIAAFIVVAGFGVTCFVVIKEGTDNPAYTLFVSILSAALATLFGRELDGPGSP